MLVCVECGREAFTDSKGWRAYREDPEEANDTPALAILCPECAAREFGTQDQRNEPPR